jgi:hypothetical protein
LWKRGKIIPYYTRLLNVRTNTIQNEELQNFALSQNVERVGLIKRERHPNVFLKVNSYIRFLACYKSLYSYTYALRGNIRL